MRSGSVWASFLVCWLVGAVAAPANALEWFLWIDGIQGEADDPAHAEWIEVRSVSIDVTRVDEGSIGGGITGEPIVRPLVINKDLDSASVPILAKALTGDRIADAKLVAYQESGNPVPGKVYEIELTDVFVSYFSQVADTDSPTSGKVRESIALVFNEMCLEYTPIDGAGSSISRCWDLVNNSPY